MTREKFSDKVIVADVEQSAIVEMEAMAKDETD